MKSAANWDEENQFLIYLMWGFRRRDIEQSVSQNVRSNTFLSALIFCQGKPSLWLHHVTMRLPSGSQVKADECICILLSCSSDQQWLTQKVRMSSSQSTLTAHYVNCFVESSCQKMESVYPPTPPLFATFSFSPRFSSSFFSTPIFLSAFSDERNNTLC